jgi:hypothetical protein
LTPHDKALIKFGQQVLVGSIDTIRDFAKSMITLVSGLFAVYFAVLQFLGAADITKPAAASVRSTVLIPPVLFIASIIAFVFAVLPLYNKMSLNNAKSIRNLRQNSFRVKYIFVGIGTALFLIGMIVMALVAGSLLAG